MESRVMSCSQERASKEDSTDGYQGDGGRGFINKRVGAHSHTATAPLSTQTTALPFRCLFKSELNYMLD